MADAPIYADVITRYVVEPIMIRDNCGAAEVGKWELLRRVYQRWKAPMGKLTCNGMARAEVGL